MRVGQRRRREWETCLQHLENHGCLRSPGLAAGCPHQAGRGLLQAHPRLGAYQDMTLTSPPARLQMPSRRMTLHNTAITTLHQANYPPAHRTPPSNQAAGLWPSDRRLRYLPQLQLQDLALHVLKPQAHVRLVVSRMLSFAAVVVQGGLLTWEMMSGLNL
jgi:hypothetical protein